MSPARRMSEESSSTDLADLLRTVLKNRLRTQGLTQAELARRAGISAAGVSALMVGSVDGYLSTWSRLFEALDRDALDVWAAGSLSPSVLTRPMNPRIVMGDYSHDLSYAMHDVTVRGDVRVWQIDLPVAQLEDLFAGRAYLQVDRVLDRTGIAFAPADLPVGTVAGEVVG